MGTSKQLSKVLKKHSIKVKQKDTKSDSSKFKFNIIDVSPVNMYSPKKYYTARMEANDNVDYLKENDILIIDPSIKRVKDSGIYIFEFRGHVLVRQFQVIFFGENKNTYKAIGTKKSKDNEYYPQDEVNVLGAVISKQVELFHGLYGIRKAS